MATKPESVLAAKRKAATAAARKRTTLRAQARTRKQYSRPTKMAESGVLGYSLFKAVSSLIGKKSSKAAASKTYPKSNVKVINRKAATAAARKRTTLRAEARTRVDKAGAEGPKKAAKRTPAQIAAAKQEAWKRVDNRMNKLSRRIALHNRTNRLSG